MSRARQIRHGELLLALHELRAGSGLPLLLVHDLGGSSAAWRGDAAIADAWRGPLVALDLAGHGDSQWRVGGAYTPELFAGDLDAAIAEIGACAVLGAGLGAYVALLVAGARPAVVRGAVLLPGAGLGGGGAAPDPTRHDGHEWLDEARRERRAQSTGVDPLARACAEDYRPPDFARSFVVAARRLVLVEDGAPRPPWWSAAREVAGVEVVDAQQASAALAQLWTAAGG